MQALGPTTLPKGRNVDFDLELGGDMKNYLRSINGEFYPMATPLIIKRGQNVNVNFIKKTDMDNPMHLHGHLSRYLSANEDNLNAPLMDTVNVSARETQRFNSMPTIQTIGSATAISYTT